MNSFGDNLKKLRKERGISQKKLALDLEIAQSTVANYEKNNRFPKEDIILSLVDYFEVSVDYLMGRNLDRRESDIKIKSKIRYLDFSHIDDDFYEFACDYFYDLIIKNDLESAYDLVDQIYASGGEILDIYNKIFTKSLIKLGDMWQEGTIDVATEHQFSSLTEIIMARLHSRVKRADEVDKKVLCMNLANEKHLIASKMICNFANYCGLKSFYIGQGVPYKDLEIFIKKNSIDLLIISMTIENSERSLDEFLNFIDNSSVFKGVDIIFGGQFFKDKDIYRKYKNCSIVLTLEDIADIFKGYEFKEAQND